MEKPKNTPEKLNINSFIERSKHKNKDLMQNLKEHLQFLEEKHDLKARKAIATTLCSALTGTLLLSASGLSYSLNNSIPVDTSTIISMATMGGLSLGATLIAGAIANNQSKKRNNYGYLRQIAEIGCNDSEKLQKAKDIISANGDLEQVKTVIMQKTNYVEDYNNIQMLIR